MAVERVAARRAGPLPVRLLFADDENVVSTPPTGAPSARPTRSGYATRRP
ncbi:hypothetical protein [Streptosporangium sp. NPDC006930]